jgi:hypothetical protein
MRGIRPAGTKDMVVSKSLYLVELLLQVLVTLRNPVTGNWEAIPSLRDYAIYSNRFQASYQFALNPFQEREERRVTKLIAIHLK